MSDRDAPLGGMHAVVTGASRGIGRAVAARLADLGAAVTLVGRDAARLATVAAELRSAHEPLVCDVANADDVARTFERVAAAGAGLDILVNNAGVASSASFAATDDALWTRMLDVNLTGVYRCTRAALPLLRAAAAGRVVNIASTAGLRGYAYVAAYCAAKHVVVGLTRALALELASTAITVNAVCPGYTDTDLVTGAIDAITRKTGRSVDAARAALVASNPQGRLVTPAEVASAVAWLCLPESQSITGQAIAVCGGEVTTG